MTEPERPPATPPAIPSSSGIGAAPPAISSGLLVPPATRSLPSPGGNATVEGGAATGPGGDGSEATGSTEPATFSVSSLSTVTVAAGFDQPLEIGDMGELIFTRDGDTSSDLTVFYTVSGTATPATDYEELPGSVTIFAGATSESIGVFTIDDTLIEGDETVVVTLSTDASYTVGSPDTATITIIDDESGGGTPTVTIAASAPEASEDGLLVGGFLVERSGDTTSNLDVSYTVDGTATPLDDYTPLAGVVTIFAGDTSAVIDVFAADDTVSDPDETVIVTLSTDPAYTVGSPDTATVTIIEDGSGGNLSTVTIAASQPTAREDGTANGEFLVSRSGGDTTLSLTVSYTIGGTAGAGDYQSLAGSVTIPTDALNAPIALVAQDDKDVEVDETVILTLAASAAYTIGSPSAATVKIIDDEPPLVSIAANDPDAWEDPLDPGEFTVSRVGNTENDLTVWYAVDGTAKPDNDYNALPGSVTILAGATSASIVVTPRDETVDDADETVTLTLLEEPTSYTVDVPASATVTIHEDTGDTETIVSIAAAVPEAYERHQYEGAFTVSRDGDLTADLAVSYAVTGTASPTGDYVALSGSVLILAGQTAADILVRPADDGSIEPREFVDVTLSADPAYVVGAGAASVSIVDDDTPVTIDSTDALASETGSNGATLTVTRAGDTSEDVDVYFVLGGTAREGADYESLLSYVTILAGQTAAAISIVVIDDAWDEGDESVELLLAPGLDYTTGAPDTATAIIADDPLDSGPVVTVAAAANASESGPTSGEFTFNRTGDVSAGLTVPYNVFGDAEAGNDYTALSGTVTFLAGSSTAMVPLAPIDDGDAEIDEAVNLVLAEGAAYDIGGASEATVTISDNEQLVWIEASDPDAAEATLDPGEFTVHRLGPTNLAVDVFYTVSGTARPDDDYEPLLASVTIPAGQNEAVIVLDPFDDGFLEGDETVELTIDPDPAYVVGLLATATVTIQDESTDTGSVISIAANIPAAFEAGELPGQFTVTRTGDTSGELWVNYSVSTASGQATPGDGTGPNDDYLTLSGQVRIFPGDSSATVDVLPFDDAIGEDEELVQVTLLASTGALYDLAPAITAAVVIVDNDKPRVDLDIDADNSGAIDRTESEERAEGTFPGRIIVLKDVVPAEIHVTPNGHDLTGYRLRVTPEEPEEIRLWADANKETPLPSSFIIGTDTIPETIYVEGIAQGQGQLLLSLTNPNDESDPNATGDLVRYTVLSFDLIAFRPQSEGPRYGRPLARTLVPAEYEDAVGIRRNGDDDNDDGVGDYLATTQAVGNENDLIEVQLSMPPSQGITYVLERSSRSINVWPHFTKAMPSGTYLTPETGDSVEISRRTEHGTPTLWIEWASMAASDKQAQLRLHVRDAVQGHNVYSTALTFRPFLSTAIFLGGENQDPSDPIPTEHAGNYGLFQTAIEEYRNGYDVHMFNEDHVAATGAGAAFEEVVSAIRDRVVTEVAIVGYSHGAGSTYHLSRALSGNRHILPPFQLVFSSYILMRFRMTTREILTPRAESLADRDTISINTSGTPFCWQERPLPARRRTSIAPHWESDMKRSTTTQPCGRS
ncbi:MAG: hypothetical protein KY476_06025 [Planctomycetes bacterium]|nr:hypothetical protein [Planctomycetota bacterium]